jgi:hypothetical protein
MADHDRGLRRGVITTPSGEGSFGLPSRRRRGTGALHAPVTTTLWMENTLAAQAMMMVHLRTAAPLPETGLPFK